MEKDSREVVREIIQVLVTLARLVKVLIRLRKQWRKEDHFWVVSCARETTMQEISLIKQLETHHHSGGHALTKDTCCGWWTSWFQVMPIEIPGKGFQSNNARGSQDAWNPKDLLVEQRSLSVQSPMGPIRWRPGYLRRLCRDSEKVLWHSWSLQEWWINVVIFFFFMLLNNTLSHWGRWFLRGEVCYIPIL